MKLLKELHENITDDVSHRVKKAFDALSHKKQLALLNKAKVNTIEELIKQSKSHYDLLTQLTTESAQPDKQQYVDAAKRAIKNDDPIVQDVADHHNQKVDNVKHMNWFIKAVAIDLAARDGNKEVFYESINEGVEHTNRLITAATRAAISVVSDTKLFLTSMWNDPKSGVKKEFKTKQEFIKDGLPDHIGAAVEEFEKLFRQAVKEEMKDN